MEEYEGRLNPIAEYFNEQVIIDPTIYPTLRSSFRKDFCKWAEANGFDNMKSIGATRFWDLFKKVLKDNGITDLEEVKIDGNYHVKGIGIRP